jgi:hypothetical protein
VGIVSDDGEEKSATDDTGEMMSAACLATESEVSPSIFHLSAFTGIRVIPIFLDRKGE